MNEITIRDARREDIPSIVDTCQESTTEEELIGFSAPDWATYREVNELRKIWTTSNRLKDDYEIIVAEKSGQIVGFLVFKRYLDSYYIDDLDIRKSEQGKGIGRALVEHIEGC